jgi:hypothetical protein
MVYFLAAAVTAPRRAGMALSLALLIATATEVSRLYHTPWLDSFRNGLAGALLLGKHFSLWNIVAYAVGIVASGGLHRLAQATKAPRRMDARAPAPSTS